MPDPFDPFAPRSTTREGRLSLLGQAADDLLAERLPCAEARVFLASALDGWLRHGGNWQKYVRCGAPRGSHATHERVYLRIIADEESEILDCGIVGSSLFEEPQP